MGCDNESFVYDNDEEPLAWALRGRKMEFTASSPDEKVSLSHCQVCSIPICSQALVEACQRLGVTFVGEDEVQGTIRIVDSRGSGPPSLKTFQRLQVLEFDSTRKRMSVIVRYPCGRVFIVTKGAETSVLPLCLSGPIEATNRDIDRYALVGLRTLAVACRQLSERDLAKFEQDFAAAQQAIEQGRPT